jgi:hypothetical protein
MTAPYIGQFERALQTADLVEAIDSVEALA